MKITKLLLRYEMKLHDAKFYNDMKIRLFCLFFLGTLLISAQSIEKKWVWNTDATVEFQQGKYQLTIPQDSLVDTGNYLEQNNLLVLFSDKQQTPVKFQIQSVTDSTMTFMLNGKEISAIAQKEIITHPPKNQLKPNIGITASGIIRGVLGMAILLLIAYVFSSNRKKINWKTVGIGLSLQLLLAIGVLRVSWVKWIFEKVGSVFVLILDFTKAGSEFLLGSLLDTSTFGFIFIFQILPTIIFFSALTSLLFYFGVIQIIVKGLAWVLTRFLGISGAESLSVAGNIFLGQTEAPLMIKAYLAKMTRSEILLVMVGGMATVAGGVLASYIGFLGGNDPVLRLEFAKHLLAASVMAAPGAIVVSKMLYPQTEKFESTMEVSNEQIGSNVLDVIATGTTEGLKLAANVGAMLLVFVAMIAMVNYIFGWIGDLTHLNGVIAANTPYDKFSLEMLLGTIFSPLMWIIGVAKEDMMLMGQLLGVKLASSEFVGYTQLAVLKDAANPIHFTYQKSVIMATYMLCGFANFASIGIQIGGIGSLAPSQRKNLSEFGLKAVLGGTLASLLSATIAGMIIG